MKVRMLLCTLLTFSFYLSSAQQSIARQWNEELLNAIRLDYARPTIHARNLFHTSVAMYDLWALFDPVAETVFLGKDYKGYTFNFNGITPPGDIESARHEMISYVMYRLLIHRFSASPNATETLNSINTLFNSLGYDSSFVSTDYSTNSYAALGNYFASEIINFGLQDGANEANIYLNRYYTPSNDPLILELYNDNTGINPNLWQPLAFDVFIDQSGNEIPISTPAFLSPEWGEVIPFALKDEDLEIINDNFDCYVYNNPGPPPLIQDSNENGIEDPYKWYFSLVVAWSSHLDPNDATLIDISPASIGNMNINDFPETFEDYKSFYDFENGGDSSMGHLLNPSTGMPYSQQLVKRSDYSRVLAEFWADGPDSETPPGHWFTIMNYVSDHPDIVKQFGGEGPVLTNLEWDIKSYLALGGAMHDAAVNTWGLKGYYDYIRPISAIRYMAGKGQSTDSSLPSYDPHGLPLINDLIELIEIGDPLAGDTNENVNKMKVKSWKGPDYITNPDTDTAGVDWILAEKWWPYQRPTFVTPPFAGYLSGHSTFSRAASEILTLVTGDPFFPSGMGTFDVTQNDFLVFEEGPTENFTLQWATYRDASDQTSLSRIWGGIHPPIDDIKGRIIGEKIGVDAFNLAIQYYNNTLSTESNNIDNQVVLYPNPIINTLNIQANTSLIKAEIYNINGALLNSINISKKNNINLHNLATGLYFIKLIDYNNEVLTTQKIIKK